VLVLVASAMQAKALVQSGTSWRTNMLCHQQQALQRHLQQCYLGHDWCYVCMYLQECHPSPATSLAALAACFPDAKAFVMWCGTGTTNSSYGQCCQVALPNAATSRLNWGVAHRCFCCYCCSCTCGSIHQSLVASYPKALHPMDFTCC